MEFYINKDIIKGFLLYFYVAKRGFGIVLFSGNVKITTHINIIPRT